MPEYSVTLDLAHDCLTVRDLETGGTECYAMECAAQIDGEEG